MNTSAREIALLSLCRYEREEKYSNIEADAAIKKFKLVGAEKKLYTKLLYGTIEKKLTLDYIIQKLSSRKLDDMSLQMKNILRMSIYQMRYLDKIPDNAAVNEGVELAKKFEKPAAASFANAVLRKYASEGDKIKLPDKREGIIRYLSVNYSVGYDVATALVESLGESDAELMLKKINETEHYVTLRVNTLKTTREELKKRLSENDIKCEECNASPFGLKVLSYIEVPKLLSVVGNDAFIEDEASQLAVSMLDCKPNFTVVDTCAAPGGKTVSCAIEMENTGKIYAFDLHENKIKLINKVAENVGVTIIEAACRNGKAPDERLFGMADRVLCDVPCSNIGVIAKKPEVRYKKLSDIDSLVMTQEEILEQSAKYLKIGGKLLYSTCTVDNRENGENVRSFLSRHPDYSLTYEKTLMPHKDFCDGFYISVITKNG